MFRIAVQLDPFVAITRTIAIDTGNTLTQAGQAILGEKYHSGALLFFDGDGEVPVERYDDIKPQSGDRLLAKAVYGDPVGLAGSIGSWFAHLFLTTGVPTNLAFSAGFQGTVAAGVTAGANVGITGLTTLGWATVLSVGAEVGRSIYNSDGAINRPASIPVITGGSNTINKWGIVPTPLGEHLMYPPLAAPAYTEFPGYRTVQEYADSSNPGSIINPQRIKLRDEKINHLRTLLVWGPAPVTIRDIKVGNTQLSSVTGQNDIEHDLLGTRGDLKLFEYALQDKVDFELSDANAWHTVETRANTNEFHVTISFPNGLYKQSTGTGNRTEDWTVSLEGQYRKKSSAPDGDWTQFFNEDIRRATRDFFAISRSQSGLDADTYEVRCRRKVGKSDRTEIFDTLYWIDIRSYRPSTGGVIKETGIAKTAIRFTATDQLSGALDQVNAIAGVQVPTWTGNGWTTVRSITRNPAALFRYVAIGDGRLNPLEASQVDDDELGEWYEFCETNNYEYSKIVNTEQSTFELMGEIAAAGFASTHLNASGKYSVIIDRLRSTATMLITPKNSWGFSGSMSTEPAPHALRVQFINRDVDYEEDEVTVYADGYGLTADTNNNVKEATRFETKNFPGVTKSDHAQALGLRYLRTIWQRPKTYTVSMDFENLVAEKGDRVKFQYDTALIGQVSARVKDISAYTDFTLVTLDDIITFETGKVYSFVIRTIESNESRVRVVEAFGTVGSTTQAFIRFDDSGGLQAGDLVSFGERNLVTEDCIVIGIERKDDLTATLTLAPYSESIYSPKTIPPYTSVITPRTSLSFNAPETPTIERIISDEQAIPKDAAGVALPSMRIYVDSGSPSEPDPNVAQTALYEVRWRKVDGENNYQYTTFPYESEYVVISGLEIRVEYEVGVRAVSPEFSNGKRGYSDWATATHTVVGLGAPPADVNTFRLARINDQNFVQFTYSNPPPDLVGFEIRYNSSPTQVDWQLMRPIARLDRINRQYSIPNLNGTYAIKAFDSAGVYSRNAKYANASLLDTPDETVVHTIVSAPGWEGTRTNVTVAAGRLKLTSDDFDTTMSTWTRLSDVARLAGRFFRGEGSYVTPSFDVGAIYNTKVTADIFIFGGEAVGTAMSDWPNLENVQSLAQSFDPTFQVITEVRYKDHPQHEYSAYQEFDILNIRSRVFQFRIRLIPPTSEASSPVLSKGNFILTLKTREETGRNVSTSGDGNTVTVSFAKPFLNVPVVTLQLQNAIFEDKLLLSNVTKTGFQVRGQTRSSDGFGKSWKVLSFDWRATGV